MKSDLSLFCISQYSIVIGSDLFTDVKIIKKLSRKVEKILTDERCQKVRLVELNLSGRLLKKVNLFKLASNCQ